MKIKINITEGMGCGGCQACDACTTPEENEARMHRTTLAHLMADVKVLMDLVQDGDNLPEWLETKITKAGDYMSSAARYLAGDEAREQGQLEEGMCEVEHHPELHEALQDAVTEDYEIACAECLYETILESADSEEMISEAEYRGRKVKLNKPMRGDVKKFKVYVKDPKTGNVKKVNFGDKNMRIKKSNPKRRKSFRARHNCKNPGPKTKARYWSCRKW